MQYSAVMEFDTLRFEFRDGVARITLARPEAANAINLELARELMHAAIRCDEDAAIRAVLLTGEGKIFCAGGDLRAFASQADALSVGLKELTTYLHAAVSRFVRMDAPLVVAVNGSAGGAGMSLACAADLALAAESAKFTMAYTAVGLTPDGSSTFFLTRIVGLRRAMELTLTNRTLSAQEAFEWGIVNRVVPDSELFSEADALARQLAQGSLSALGGAKRLLYGGVNETLETQMELETRAIAAAARSADAREGVAAFLEKRRPRFGSG